MELIRVDTKHAYKILREKITSLELKPGQALDIGRLANQLDIAQASVKEALRLLAHDHLVEAPPRGLYVTELHLDDLKKISGIRLRLETYSAQEAAQHRTPDDLVILTSLCEKKAEDTGELFELDHKFHQAIAQAAHNKYLANTLEHFYGLSKRLWYLALPYLDFLPTAVESHIKLVEAIEEKEGETAGEIMHTHISDFYQKIKRIITERDLMGSAR